MFVRLSTILLAAATYAAAACESLSSLKLDQAAINSAQIVAAGAFSPPSGRAGRGPNLYQTLPVFCRVQVTLTPSSDSDIKVEVWLPVSGWNNKYLWAMADGRAQSPMLISPTASREAMPRPLPTQVMSVAVGASFWGTRRSSSTSPGAPNTK